MERKLKRLAAMFLFGCMLAGSFPGDIVYAQDADTLTEESQTGENSEYVSETSSDIKSDITEDVQDDTEASSNQASEDDVQNNDSEQTADNMDELDDIEESSVQNEDAKSEDKQTQEDGVIEKNADEINYVIVESPYLETPGTERIAVSYGDGSENVSDATLTVRKDNGQDSVWDLSVSSDQLYLFSNEFTDESESGTYEVISLNVTGDDGVKTVLFSDYELEACFGINEEYSGIEELQPLDAEDAQSRTVDEVAGVEATVAEINPENIEESAEQIVNALQNAEEYTEGVSQLTTGVSAFAETVWAEAGNAAAARSSNGNIVVALDPGHDSKHAGTSSNGLKEEVLTLKIAQYCKQELEQYSGVTVYMTRTGAACPYPNTTSSGADIAKRVYAAADAGADIYVSIHLNSSTSSSANGAEVIIPNDSWKPQLAQEGEELAEAILKELKAIGLNMRPDEIYSKDTTVNERYPDNSISDYFAVQIYAKERDIPGIIVEHAFLTNSGDRSYLDNEAGLKKLGVADATGIAKYLGLSKGYWSTDNQGNKYYYVNGNKVKGVYKIGTDYYYFDPQTGAMYTGFLTLNGSTYYYHLDDGTLALGVEKINGNWYYFSPETGGAMHTGFLTVGGNTYYYDSNGKIVIGTAKINGSWYYFSPETGGAMHTGFLTVGGNTYYYNTNGKLVIGTAKVNGSWYYFSSETGGAMYTGILIVGEQTYYYYQSGKLALGTAKIDGNWYYFDVSTGGAMHTGFLTVDDNTYYYDQTGKLVLGTAKIDGNWYYFDVSKGGAMHTGFLTVGEDTYYYDQTGKLVFGTAKVNGEWYYFDVSTGGAMHTGFLNVGENTYYYDQEGKLVLGTVKIDGEWYYFDTISGVMYTGFLHSGTDIYYYKPNGQLVFGQYDINGLTFYFDENTGRLIQEYYTIMGSSQGTVEQMVSAFNARNKEYPTEALTKGGAPTIREFCNILVEEAENEGVKAEVLFCQVMKETGWLQFGGIVKVEQYNFGGLGATDVNGEANSAWFKDVRTGLRAQVQHLKAYGSNENLKEQCVDPRFDLVVRNSAVYVQWLGQKENPNGYGWATSEMYGYEIVASINKLLKM